MRWYCHRAGRYNAGGVKVVIVRGACSHSVTNGGIRCIRKGSTTEWSNIPTVGRSLYHPGDIPDLVPTPFPGPSVPSGHPSAGRQSSCKNL